MGGPYQSKRGELITELQHWINQVISGKLWERYADLHIDTVDQAFKRKQNWIAGSLFLFDCISSLIDETKYNVLLVIPLSHRSASNLEALATLKLQSHELDTTPPSFYLFPKGEKNYEVTIRSAKQIGNVTYRTLRFPVYYKEESNQEECYKTLYLTNPEE